MENLTFEQIKELLGMVISGIVVIIIVLAIFTDVLGKKS